MSSSVFERIKSSGQLPSPTGVAIDLYQLSMDPEARIEDIIAVVERDPATAARILKFANSAFAGIRVQVADIRRAVVLLGMRTVVNLTLGFSLISGHKRGGCPGFDYEEFWSSSTMRAAAARQLASDVLDPHEAFTCGLLSQIGRLALATVFPQEYGEVLGFCESHCMAKLVELERRRFEIDHNQLTAEMMADWQLPADFSEAVRHQDAPHKSGLESASVAGRLAHLLHLGGLMGALIALAEVRREYIVNVLAAAHRMDIPRADFPPVFDAISDAWRQTSDILPVRTHAVAGWEQLYASCRQPVMAPPPSARMLGRAG